MSENIKNVIVYHDNCQDGYCSRAIMELHFTRLGESFVSIPGTYQEDIPFTAFIDKDVYLVDFSYKRDDLVGVCKLARKVVVLDHHQSAAEDLKDLDKAINNLTLYYDIAIPNEWSGAMLCWKTLFTEPVPKIVQHVCDRDLWKFELDGTKEIDAFLRRLKGNPKSWTAVLLMNDISDLMVLGEAYCSTLNDITLEVIDNYRYVDLFGRRFPVMFNCPYSIGSDAMNLLCKAEHNDSGMAGSVIVTEKGGVTLRLRSIGDIDVKAIAKTFEGGGHPNAASFKVTNVAVLDRLGIASTAGRLEE